KVDPVHHMLLKSWDHGSNVTTLIKAMEKLQGDFNMEEPTVVHCINGAGRTGIFLAVKSEMERIRMENKVDLFNTVRQLRGSNHSMVLSKDDYGLCHHLLKEDNPQEPEYANI
ncbi:hypothetical protein BSL78_05647, partial [Apostichopus japonicus]